MFGGGSESAVQTGMVRVHHRPACLEGLGRALTDLLATLSKAAEVVAANPDRLAGMIEDLIDIEGAAQLHFLVARTGPEPRQDKLAVAGGGAELIGVLSFGLARTVGAAFGAAILGLTCQPRPASSWGIGRHPGPAASRRARRMDLPGTPYSSMSQPRCSGCSRPQRKVEFLHENHQRVGYSADQRR